jgi:exopolysaccharide biosynthesis polyprenyl glycosylphosphotransferase
MIKRNWRTLLIFFALTIDVIAIILSAILAIFIRSFIPNLPVLSPYMMFQLEFIFGMMLIVFAMIIGVYRATSHSNLIRQYFLAGKAYLYTILCLFSFLYVFQSNSIPRRFTLLFFLILPFIFITGRWLFNQFAKHMQKRGYGIHNVLLAGYDNAAISVIDRLRNFPELGYCIKGIVTTQTKRAIKPIKINGAIVARFNISEVDRIIKEFYIDRIFILSTNAISNGYFTLLDICAKKRIKLKILSKESEDLLKYSRVWDIAGISLILPKRDKTEKAKYILKNIFDFVGALILILLLLPLLLIIAIAIFIEDGYPIIFTQKRALIKGKNEFQFIKFRSMIKGAESKQSDLYKFNEVSGGLFLMKDDPRITKVGRLLRTFSLDELPQLFNVLLGDMSLVGPRPLSIADLSNISAENKFDGHYKLRANAKPGITGLWQISGRRETNFRDMVLLDLYYVENQSLLFDLEILFATLPVVLFGKGAY